MSMPTMPHAYWTENAYALVLAIPELDIQVRLETPLDNQLACFALMGALSWFSLTSTQVDLVHLAAVLRAQDTGQASIQVSYAINHLDAEDKDNNRFLVTRKGARCCVCVPSLGLHLLLPCPEGSTVLTFDQVLPRFKAFCAANQVALSEAVFMPRSCPPFPDDFQIVWHGDIAYLVQGAGAGKRETYLGLESELRPFAEEQVQHRNNPLRCFYYNILELLEKYPNPNAVKPRPE